ncbi:MAG: nucleotidyl transferase AbiEii/AbiGii toxin family protein [Acidimicrobiaceae bacterium]|nr:nucleotidyl transferase AbiEii/AbiGii toxin family protein [Acidimicrobiaceae bacterium]
MSEKLLGLAADVLRSFGSAFGGRHLAIVGGVVPSLLVDSVPAGIKRHVGTADLDLHLSLHLMDGETADYYEAIIDGLRNLGLRPDRRDGRDIKWRWIGTYREVRLQVEFLCPVRTQGGHSEAPAAGTPAEQNIGPSDEITALAVGFGDLVTDDTIIVERVVETNHGRLRYEFPVAGVASWLCLKADAIMRRDKPKDAYDVVWLIVGLGSAVAAERVRASPLLHGPRTDEVIAQLARLAEQFVDVDAVGARSYADFLDSQNSQVDRRYAVEAVAEFWRRLNDLTT